MKVSAMIAALLLAICCGCSAGVSVDDWLKVKEGMEPAEVKLILGEPRNIKEIEDEYSGKTLYWDYLVKGEEWSVVFSQATSISRWYVSDRFSLTQYEKEYCDLDTNEEG